MATKPPRQVDFNSEFLKRLKQIRKKYPHADEDIRTLIDQLEKGETPGDRIVGVKNVAYKVRIRSSDQSKGKSGGYRVIYYIHTTERVILISLYAKARQADIAAKTIKKLIQEYENSFENDD